MARRRSFLSFPLVAILTVLALTLLLGGIEAVRYLGTYRGFATESFVEIEHGMTSRQIARTLAAQGVVRSPLVFLAIRTLHPRATLEAGEYRFDAPVTPFTVFDKLRRGDVFYEEFTVPEGSNIFDIATLLQNTDTVDAEAFLKAAASATSIHDLDPLAPDLEGYLFPSTYRLTHHTTASQL